MAFMGMVFGIIFLIFIAVVAIVVFILLIVATILLICKRKKPAIILYSIASVPVVISTVVIGIFIYKLNFPRYDTYDGHKVTISLSKSKKMKELIEADDMEGLDRLLDRNPELIYYLDNNHVNLLDYGLYNCNIEIMEIALDHGARFDDENAYDMLVYNSSLDGFFERLGYNIYRNSDETYYEPGVTTDEMIEAIKFAVDNGAATTWEPSAFQNKDHDDSLAIVVSSWIKRDNGIVDGNDKKLLDYAKSVS